MPGIDCLIPSHLRNRAKAESMAQVKFPCPVCNFQLPVEIELAGRRVACPKCRHEIQLPQVWETPAPPASPAPTEQETDNLGDEAACVAAETSEPIIDVEAANLESSPVTETDNPEPAEDPDVGGPATMTHPLLPPVFLAAPGDPTVNHWPPIGSSDGEQVFLPASSGGVQPVDPRMATVVTRQGKVQIALLPQEKVEKRRRIRSAVVYLLCTVVLIGVFIYLLNRLT